MQSAEKVTLSLPKDLMETVRDMAPARGQSRFVAEAIAYYIAERKRQATRERLIAGYQANAEADAAIDAEWEAVDDEAWHAHVPRHESEEARHETAAGQ